MFLSSRFKWLLVLLAIVGSTAGFFWWKKSNSDSATTYLTAPVTRGDIIQAVTATGALNAVVNVTVGSQISGNIQKLFADFNTRVKEGQVIAQIDPATYKANVTQAQGDLANAKAALELAKISADRTTRLRAQSSASAADVDQAIATLHQAQAQVTIKEGSLAKAQADLERCTIYAPIDGIVISRSVDVGQTVAASMTAPVLFSIANDLSKMQIDANVAEADIGAVEVGQKVDFTVDAFPYRIFHGTVVQIRNSPLTVQNVVTYDTVISVDNPDLKLKPGMTANVSIIVAERKDVLKIGNAALRIRLGAPAAGSPATGDGSRSRKGSGGAEGSSHRRQSGDRRPNQTVYLLPANAKEPQPKEIQPGITDGVSTEVISGLNEGDTVVTAVIQPTTSDMQRPASNPFGGAPRMR
ncbi:MAG TPA: efflux RND transporter periplasmic adaptor subunit [Chthoniobacterales bacterium]